MRKKKLFIILVATLAMFAGQAYVEYATRMIWVGGYNLAVRIETDGDMPVKVRTATAHTLMDADEEVEILKEQATTATSLTSYKSPIFVPVRGESFSVWVQTSGVSSRLFGLELEYHQRRALVVQADWPDGRRVCKVVSIPDGRKSREVVVTLP